MTDMWKASTNEKYPLNIPKLANLRNGSTTRGMTNEHLVEPRTLKTFIGDATRIWNKAPS